MSKFFVPFPFQSVQIRSYFWTVFSCIRTESEDLRRSAGLLAEQIFNAFSQ